MEKIKLYYNIIDSGDGSAWISWHLTEENRNIAAKQEESDFMIAPISEGDVETFIGSDIYNYALQNDADLKG